MSNAVDVVVSEHGAAESSLRGYVTGFILSVYLTLTAYVMTVHHLFRGWGLLGAVAGLALLQLLVQLIFFLHLGRESKPRWNLLVFLFMLIVVVILVSGSIWIMYNLNYHHDHSTQQTEQTIIRDENLHQ